MGHPRRDPPNQPLEERLRVARRFFPDTVPFRQYIGDLREHKRLQLPGSRTSWLVLRPPGANGGGSEEAVHRLVDRLYVAWPSGKSYPDGVVDSPRQGSSISMDLILQDVIVTTLRRHASSFDAQKANVLCNGFSLTSQHGKGSVLPNLDARSPSAQLQVLRSPAWKALLSRIGHVVVRHLLMNNVLLQSHSHAFLQLCGPPSRECSGEGRIGLRRSNSDIVLKQDVLYRTPTHREDDFSRAIRRAKKGLGPCEKIPLPYNDGLPISHHLQGLVADARTAAGLAIMIFSSPSRKGPSASGRPTVDAMHLQDFDRLATEINGKSVRTCERGIQWVRERRPLNKRLSRVVPILRRVIKKVNSVSLRRVLGRTCPLPVSARRCVADGSGSCPELIRMHSQPRHVANFLIVCVRHIVPTDIFGSSRNRYAFESNVRKLICRRLKRESFSIHRFCSQAGLRVTDVEWLYRRGENGRRVCNPSDLKFRQKQLERLYSWLFHGVVLSIVNQNFYVTDGDLHRNRLFFYRREVWSRLVDIAHRNMLRGEKRFSPLSQDGLSDATSRRRSVIRSLGPRISPYPVLLYHQLRFVPKRFSLRGIQRPRGEMLYGFSGPQTATVDRLSRARPKLQGMKSIAKAKGSMKKLFRHILKVLASEASEAAVLGASVFSLDDIYAKMISLKAKWRHCNCPAMYVCCVDIATSFDTIPLKALFSDVIPELLSKERYACLRYRVSKASISREGVSQRYLVHVCSEPGEETSFKRIVQEKLSRLHSRAVFTDLVQLTTLSRDQILLALREFLSNNLIAVPRRSRRGSEKGFALQTRGVPQGHSLSSLLTSLFYAHVEKHDLTEFVGDTDSREDSQGRKRSASSARWAAEKQDSCQGNPNLLMRQVDDTIFMTTSKEEAERFLWRMRKGWESTHGFRVNVGKTRCNFPSGIKAREEGTLMPWCGLFVNTETLEITVDYTRYGQNEGGCLRDSVFVEHEAEVGRIFADRARTCFKPKLHPVLLDAQINSRATIALNVYQAALLSCLKLSSYASIILPTADHLTLVVQEMVGCFVGITYRSLTSKVADGHSSRFPFSPMEVRFLATHAFHRGITKRLARARRMGTRAALCVAMLKEKLSGATKKVISHRDSRLVDLAESISKHRCHVLWKLKL